MHPRKSSSGTFSSAAASCSFRNFPLGSLNRDTQLLHASRVGYQLSVAGRKQARYTLINANGPSR